MNVVDDPRGESRSYSAALESASGSTAPKNRPLSPEQLAIWEATDAELAGAHNRVFTVSLPTRCEGERLEHCFERLLSRREELRTTFHAQRQGPVEQVQTAVPFQLEFVDASRWGEREFEQIVRLTGRQPIDLATCALRAVLFSRSESDHVLLVVAHRIAGSSERMRALIGELLELYGGEMLLDEIPDESSTEVFSFDGTVLDPFDWWAGRYPDRIALREPGRTLTYGELDRRANQLARHFRQRGADPRCCVAMDLPATADAIIATLAALKLGAACLPYDGTSTVESAAAAEACPVAVLTKGEMRISLSVPSYIVLDLGSTLRSIESTSREPLGVGAAPRDAALLAPGGGPEQLRFVPLAQSALSNVLRSLQKRLRLRPYDRFLAFGHLGARELVLNVLLPLTSGCTVVLDTRRTRWSPAGLAQVLDEQEIDLVSAPGPVWGQLISSGWRGRPETTLCCAAARLRVGDSAALLGQPIGGARLHLLDELLRPVAPGAAGTLYVGGPGVARGYHRALDADVERFIPDPFAPDGRGLLFRTRERCVRHGNAGIERVDHPLLTGEADHSDEEFLDG